MEVGSVQPRLPTRCPACKGALIQRMPKSGRTYIWFHCLFCKNAWRIHVEEPATNPNGDVTGEIVIVTKSRMRRRLGSVVVNAISEDVLTKHLDKKSQQLEGDTRELQRRIDSLSRTLKVARAEEERLWNIQKEDESNRQKARAWSAAFNTIKNLAQQIEGLKLQRQHLTSKEYFFQNLPSPISTTKTDQNGRFTLSIPRQGRYGIVARASFSYRQETETYFWIVWVDLGGQDAKRVRLSTDNVIGAGSSESAII